MIPPIEARIHAPTAPLWQRTTAYLAGWTFLAAGLVALNSFPIATALLEIGAAVLFGASFFLYRRAAKSARISLSPGRIVIRSPRALPRVVTTRSLRGGAIARFGDRFVISLAEKLSRGSPISIELTDERAAKEIRKALGIRAAGFGEVDWSSSASTLDRLDVPSRIVAFLACIVSLIAPSASHLSGLGPLLGAAMFFSAFVSAGRIGRRAPAVILTPTHVELRQRGSVERFRCDALDGVSDNDSVITLETSSGKAPSEGTPIPSEPVRWTRSGMRREERDILLAHLRGSIVRAKDVAMSCTEEAWQVDPLRRGQSSVVDWLARVDALAASQTEPGYRGASFSAEDLWRAVEDQETAPDVRAAAARILTRIAPEKSHDRVAAALDAIQDDVERAHVRAALDSDLDAAAREIEAIDLAARS